MQFSCLMHCGDLNNSLILKSLGSELRVKMWFEATVVFVKEKVTVVDDQQYGIMKFAHYQCK